MKILDLGETFGYSCASIFSPWKPILIKYDLNRPITQIDDHKIDLIIYGGGEDICPKIYGHRDVLGGNNELSHRDILERDLYKYGKRKTKFLGICRGAQMLNALHGGWLVQHVDGHGGQHDVMLIDDPSGDTSLVTNSTHHQMMMMGGFGSLVGFTEQLSTSLTYDVRSIPTTMEVPTGYNAEIVRFEDSLAVQFHPEYESPDHKMAVKVREYVNQYLNVGGY